MFRYFYLNFLLDIPSKKIIFCSADHVTSLTCRSGRCGDMDKADVWSDTSVQASERWGRAVLLDCGRRSTREGKIDGIRASEQPRGACRCLSMLPCTVAHSPHTYTNNTNTQPINTQHTATCVCQRYITWGMCVEWRMNGFLSFLQLFFTLHLSLWLTSHKRQN